MNGMLLLDKFRSALQAGEFGIASGTVVQNKVTLTTTKDEQADGTSVWYHIQGEISADGRKVDVLIYADTDGSETPKPPASIRDAIRARILPH
jgi:hypothetical protein